MKKMLIAMLLVCSVAYGQHPINWPLKVEEVDLTPTGRPSTLKVTNGTLTDNGDGSFTLLTGSGGGGGTGTPGGADTNIQYNESDSFGGDSDFVFNATHNYVMLAPDTDATATFGRAVIGDVLHLVAAPDFAGFAHVDNATLTTFGYLHGNTGESYINSGAGQVTSFRIANTDEMTLSATTADFQNNLITTTGAITGSAITASTSTSANDLTINNNTNISGLKKHLRVNIPDPNAFYDVSTQACVIVNTDSAMTVKKIDVTLDDVPTTDLDFDLVYADTFIQQNGATVIDELNTVSGVATIRSGFDDPNVASDNCVYLQFNADPHADITQVCVDVVYVVD